MTAPLIFYPLAVLILIASIMVVSARSAIVSALFLVLDLFLLACVYASLNAHFVAAIQLLVYAGAILVLFLFVIMLLNVDPDKSKRRLHLPEAFALLVALAVFGLIGLHLLPEHIDSLTQVSTQGTEQTSNTTEVGMLLFTAYLWPFELASFLILLAMIASVVIAKKPRQSDHA